MTRVHTALSPSGPKTNAAPTPAKPKLVDAVAQRLEHALADQRLQHEKGEHDLKTEAPGDRPCVDRAAIGREGVSDPQDGNGANQRLRARHSHLRHQRADERQSGRADHNRELGRVGAPDGTGRGSVKLHSHR
jgi:hypothetical protein